MKGPSPNIVIFFEISLRAPLRSVSNYNAGACSALSMLWPRRCCVHESRARAAPWRAAAWRRDVTQQQPRQSGHRHGTELVPRRHYDVMQISDTSDTDTSVHYYDTLPLPPAAGLAGRGRESWRGCVRRSVASVGVRLARSSSTRINSGVLGVRCLSVGAGYRE